METLQRSANRGSVSTGYEIGNSLKLEADNSESLTHTGTQSTAGNARTWTWAGWIKRTELDGHEYLFSAGYTGFKFMTTENWLRFAMYDGSTSYYLDLDMVFRDTSAWYHIVGQLDTTQGTAANRAKVWVNGVLQTEFRASTNYTSIPQNTEFQIGQTGSSSNWLKIGDWFAAGRYLSAYIAEWHFTDGVANEADAFGEFDSDTGIWIPKEYTGSYGTIGYYLDFSDSANLGNDSSGNSTDFSETNISAADQASDTPTNNFCTLNILYNYAYGNTITEGATKIYGAANNWGGGKATFGLTSGKWYWEIKQLANGNTFMGLQTDGEDNISSGNAQSQNTSVVFYTDGTLQYSNGSESTTSASNSIAANSIVGFALDLDSATQTIKVYNNNSLVTAFGSSGTANLSTYNIADKTVFPFVALYDRTVNMNFGGYTVSSISSAASDANGYGVFEYAPPSGYYAICTKNLAEFG